MNTTKNTNNTAMVVKTVAPEMVKVIPPRSGSQTVDPSTALHWLENFMYKNQRPVSSRDVSIYADEMRRGTFKTTGADGTIEFVLLKGKHYLTNGQHRLWAVVESEIPQKFTVAITRVTNEEELAEVYYRSDAGKKRSDRDAFRSTGVTDEFDLSISNVTKLAAAVRLIIHGMQNNTTVRKNTFLSRDKILLTIHEWGNEMKTYMDLIKEAKVGYIQKLQKPQVLAVALVTLRDAPEVAKVFWKKVAENDGLRARDPESHLVNFIATKGVNEVGGTNGYIRHIANAWKTSWEKQNMSILRPQGSTRPLLLKGTKYKGKEHIFYKPGERLVTEANTKIKELIKNTKDANANTS